MKIFHYSMRNFQQYSKIRWRVGRPGFLLMGWSNSGSIYFLRKLIFFLNFSIPTDLHPTKGVLFIRTPANEDRGLTLTLFFYFPRIKIKFNLKNYLFSRTMADHKCDRNSTMLSTWSRQPEHRRSM